MFNKKGVLTEEQRQELYSNLVAKKQGRSPSETGAIIGGLTEGLGNIAAANTGRGVGNIGNSARELGQAQQQAESTQVAKWRELLDRDRTGRRDQQAQENTKFSQGIANRQQDRLQETLDWTKDPNNPANQRRTGSKAFPYVPTNTRDAAYVVNKETGEFKKIADIKSKEAGPKPLPASVVMQISDQESLGGSLDQLLEMHGELDTGPISTGIDMATGAAGIPNTEGDLFQSRRAAFIKDIGKKLEGGKMTDADVAFVDATLPKIGDTAETAKKKADSMRQFISEKVAKNKEALANAGYNVPNGMSDINNAASQLDPKPAKIKVNGKIYSVDENGDMTEVVQ